MQCPRCHRDVPEIAYSCALGTVCCEDCHPGGPPGPPIADPVVPRYKSREATAYAKMMRSVWRVLERQGRVYPLADGSGMVRGYCPICRLGLVMMQVVGDHKDADVIVSPCDLGCSPYVIAKALE
jgi:hypothetical protein